MIYSGVVHPALTLLIYALAVARGSVLVTEDRITQAPREWALQRLRDRAWRPFNAAARRYREQVDAGTDTDADAEALNALGVAIEARQDEGYLSYLLTCQWCVSIWLGLPAVIVWWNWPTEPWALGPAILLAFSMITGKLAQIGG